MIVSHLFSLYIYPCLNDKDLLHCMCVEVGHVSVWVSLCVHDSRSQISSSDTPKLQPQVAVNPSKWELRTSLGFSARAEQTVRHWAILTGPYIWYIWSITCMYETRKEIWQKDLLWYLEQNVTWFFFLFSAFNLYF